MMGNSTLEQIKKWLIGHQDDIILLIGVILISFLSFAAGFITAKQLEKEPIKIENENSNYWSGDLRIISGLEIS